MPGPVTHADLTIAKKNVPADNDFIVPFQIFLERA